MKAKKLTLNQTWVLCLKMWKWIAEQVKAGNEDDIEDLKEQWLKKNGWEGELDVELDSGLSMETAKNKLKGFVEEEKPEIRHGDYRVSELGSIQFFVKGHNGPMRLCQSDHLFDGPIDNWNILTKKNCAFCGNFLDDLKARFKAKDC